MWLRCRRDTPTLTLPAWGRENKELPSQGEGEFLAFAADHCDARQKMKFARWPLGLWQPLQVVDDLQDAASHIDTANSIRYPAVVGTLRGVRLEGEVPHTISQPRGSVLVHSC